MPHCFDIHGNEFPEEQLPSQQPVDPADPPTGIAPIHADELAKKTRREEILRLRLQGYSPAQIAKKLGGTETSIYHIIRHALNRVSALESKSAQKLKDRQVQLELARLDEFLMQLWPAIEGQDKRITKARAIEVALKISERRAKLLGIDQPEKQLTVNLNQDVAALSEAELEARARELGLNLPAIISAELPPPLEVANLLPPPTDNHDPAVQTSPLVPVPSSTQSPDCH